MPRTFRYEENKRTPEHEYDDPFQGKDSYAREESSAKLYTPRFVVPGESRRTTFEAN